MRVCRDRLKRDTVHGPAVTGLEYDGVGSVFKTVFFVSFGLRKLSCALALLVVVLRRTKTVEMSKSVISDFR